MYTYMFQLFVNNFSLNVNSGISAASHTDFPQILVNINIQGDSNMTGADLCVNKPQSVPVIFEPPCIIYT
jgi:hypothetical protein